MAKPISSSPFQAMEEEAYHAFREWPILLVMRQKELEMHLATVTSTLAPSSTAKTTPVDQQTVKRPETPTRE